MSVTDIIQKILEPTGIVAIIIVIGSLIKIKPLEINLWGWIARKIGNALNYDSMKAIQELQQNQVKIEKKLDNHIKENEVDQMMRCRKSILNFGREVVLGQKHTREEYQDCLLYIDTYEAYCKSHPDFPNNRAVLAIQMIKDNYHERLEKGDFLAEEYRTKVTKETK